MDDGLMGQVCGELIGALEKKDSAGVMEALRALVMAINDEDAGSGEEIES